ncbi:hypothetical protein QA802_03365 [Streptomyces sp. B21-105]|uniref:hypothetical protein n=1 Tax=Streptomyces sp. B21-105 TaxID=3039417 RepID=UPI002FF0731D
MRTPRPASGGSERPQKRVVPAEQSGHRTLAATARRQGLLLGRDAKTRAEDVRG